MIRSGLPAINVRRATLADAGLLSRLGAETFLDAFAAQNTPEDMELYLRSSFRPSIQYAELAEPQSVFLIAEAAGEITGYARLREGASSWPMAAVRPVEIVRLYARTPWIGKRVGAALMQACLTEALARGCDLIWLDVWEENPRAIAFYKKWGFVTAGSQPFRLGNDIQNDLLMARQVTLSERGGPSGEADPAVPG